MSRAPSLAPFHWHQVLRPLGVAHGNLINVTCHMVFPLWHVEPPFHLIFHVYVQWGSDVLANHPIPMLQVRATYYPRSRSPSSFQIEELVEEVKMWKDAKIGFVEMDKDRDMKGGI